MKTWRKDMGLEGDVRRRCQEMLSREGDASIDSYMIIRKKLGCIGGKEMGIKQCRDT